MAETPTITVKLDTKEATEQIRALSMALSNIHLFTDLPEVTYKDGRHYIGDRLYGNCFASNIDREIRDLLAIRGLKEADAKAAAEEAHRAAYKAEQDRNDARLEELKAAEAKKAHDDLRTSPIALKALALYNAEGDFGYGSWDAVNQGGGTTDYEVKIYIKEAEKAEKDALLQDALAKANWERSEKEAAEKLTARRDAITVGLVGVDVTYDSRSGIIKRAVDRIIELEDKDAK